MPRRLSLALAVVLAVISVLASSCDLLPRADDAADPRPATKVKRQPLPDIERELEKRLSRAGSGSSRAQFIRLFGPRARDLARRWYRNMHKLGVSDIEASVELNVRIEGGETTAIAYLVSASVFTWIAQKYNPRTATRVAIAALDSSSYDPFAELKQLKGLKGLEPQRGRAQWNDWLQTP
ncbi:MAG: hypothetical protein GEU93_21300 [Propionibacteriales bacterium]|nr:hypothetical protein [Propionibacteriales bacterium]